MMTEAHRANSEVLIVGAGPIGLETAWALRRVGVDSIVVDRGAIGATMRWWAPGTKFFSSPDRIAIAGLPMAVANQEKATREDYLGYLVQVARAHSINVRTFTSVEGIERSGGGFAVRVRDARLADGPTETLVATKVVLAIGNMHRPRLLGVTGESLPMVDHYLREPSQYVGRRVLIVGGKNSAVEAAIRLYRVGADVTISYRREAFDAKRVKYWLRPELEWLIEKQKITFLPCTAPVEFEPGRVTLAACAEGEPTGEQRTIEIDDALLLTGYGQDTSLFEQLGVELVGEARKPKYDSATMETNASGVFVAGTAVAGTELRGVRVFIENAHVHAARITRAISGRGGDSHLEDEWFGDAEES